MLKSSLDIKNAEQTSNQNLEWSLDDAMKDLSNLSNPDIFEQMEDQSLDQSSLVFQTTSCKKKFNSSQSSTQSTVRLLNK